jgi:hypothetical protein
MHVHHHFRQSEPGFEGLSCFDIFNGPGVIVDSFRGSQLPSVGAVGGVDGETVNEDQRAPHAPEQVKHHSVVGLIIDDMLLPVVV